MAIASDSGRILLEEDGSCSGSFGPFVLRTALQPIFGRSRAGQLKLRGIEGLLRLFQNGRPYSPADFFARIGGNQHISVDALCRQIHLVNASLEPAENVLLFLNFNPSLYQDNRQIAFQINRLKTDVKASRFSPSRIVCEMTEQQITKPNRMVYLIDSLREAGFKIAVDDYGAESSDARRVDLVRPDIIKLDAHWVARLMDSQSGYAVLKDTVDRFRQDGATVVLEGLEKSFQIELAWGAGADLVQGFALARPQIAPTNFTGLFGNPPA
ncbi:EAL domain-containing protein [Hoeflea sp. TYP-13]|uniref:EAL domain-containing protein n=1 Tax=Hoeflea sp. TYP-13 TaxID=3230023 RepID=UPI0034C5C549